MRQYSHRMDALIQQLYADAGSLTQSVAVFALGGYGRRELCLHSDVDLLVLFAGVIGPDDERFLHAFLNPLWDLGLTIGHHVREVSEGAALEADNSEFLLALTDARPVVGDATLLDQFLAASDVAKLRVKLVERDTDGIWSETSNPAYSPVLRKPNLFQNRIQFWECWILSKLRGRRR